MRTADTHELHRKTGKLVRASVEQKFEAAELTGKPFPKRDRRKMPHVKIDSTSYVSADRD
jgi:hypothetical protein